MARHGTLPGEVPAVVRPPPRTDRGAEFRGRDIQRYLEWRRVRRLDGEGEIRYAADRPITNRTLQKDRTVLHSIFGYADELEYRDGNPVARTRAPKAEGRRPVILDDAQYEALLRECESYPMLWLYVLALGETGGRCMSEILWLRWEDLDLEGGYLEIVSGRGGHRTKSGKSRWVPLTPRLRHALREHTLRYRGARYEGRVSPWVFHHDRTQRRHVAGERIKNPRGGFNLAARAAGLPSDFVQHDLRHRRVTTWLAGGGSPVLVKEAMGHSDLRTTMHYAHLVRENLRSLVEEERESRHAAG